MLIDQDLVRRLIAMQFPEWADLPVRPVASSGWDNRTFHLGYDMLVRLPSVQTYACQVEKEQHWLPKLAPHLPLPIPTPLALGKPAVDYPWSWSVYRWLDGETAASSVIVDLREFASELSHFLRKFQRIEATGGPLAGQHSFFRGGALATYDDEVQQALLVLNGKIDAGLAKEVWQAALATSWTGPAVWVHGDVSTGNLLVQNGKLAAVIDFGQLAVGDPACDLAPAWALFKGESREIFRANLALDSDTWARARGWTLWKFLMVAAGLTGWNAAEAKQPWRIIDEVLAEHRMWQP